MLFEEVEKEINKSIDPEPVINIDIDGIGEESREEALKLIDNISRFYYNPDFMKQHPAFKKRVDADLESLRINIKMRKADEQAHDILLKNIGTNPSNASLYRSLSEMQRTILNITTKIDETVARLNTMMKGYQTELNFDAPSDEKQQESSANIHRGSKSFIQQMNEYEGIDVDIPEDDD